MEQYDFAKVWVDSEGVRLYCTDTSEGDDLISQLKQLVPNLQMKETSKFPTGDIWFHHITALSGQDNGLLWLLIKQFGSRGWEPIGAVSYPSAFHPGDDLHYEFKRKTAG
jgi:hypothetical protein